MILIRICMIYLSFVSKLIWVGIRVYLCWMRSFSNNQSNYCWWKKPCTTWGVRKGCFIWVKLYFRTPWLVQNIFHQLYWCQCWVCMMYLVNVLHITSYDANMIWQGLCMFFFSPTKSSKQRLWYSHDSGKEISFSPNLVHLSNQKKWFHMLVFGIIFSLESLRYSWDVPIWILWKWRKKWDWFEKIVIQKIWIQIDGKKLQRIFIINQS